MIEHFIQLEQNLIEFELGDGPPSENEQILILCTHHYALQQLMQLFRRKVNFGRKPKYCWTAAVELEVSRKDLETYLHMKDNIGAYALTHNGIQYKNDLLNVIKVKTFNIING